MVTNQNKINHLAKINDLFVPLYDVIFKSFWIGGETKFRQMVVDLMSLVAGEVVLDVGCGVRFVRIFKKEIIHAGENIK